MSFVIESTGHQKSVIVRIGEALDFRTAALFKELCMEKILSGTRHFVLDFSETNNLDSTGLGTIFSLHRKIASDSGKFLFASTSQPVQVVVQLTRTYKVFHQFSTVQEACLALPSVSTS